MVWQNLSSIRGQTQKNWHQFVCFFAITRPYYHYYYYPKKHGQIPGMSKGKNCPTCKFARNKDKWILFQRDTNIVNSFSHFFIGYSKKSIILHWLKIWQLKVELGRLYKLKLYQSVLVLIIKMSQSACEKLGSHCKNGIGLRNTLLYTWLGHLWFVDRIF